MVEVEDVQPDQHHLGSLQAHGVLSENFDETIDNAVELLENFLDNFHDENAQVQVQLLTAIVKLFLKRPTDTQELVQQVLSLATQESENPDLRDRGFIYWRLLSTDPAAAKDVVPAEKPLIAEETDLQGWRCDIRRVIALAVELPPRVGGSCLAPRAQGVGPTFS